MKELVTETHPVPRVSVILCTFQGAHYLQEQLDTIARQTLQPFELVVCDDGSTDGTLDILEAFERTVSFGVRVHRNPVNLKSTKNFDQAMGMATGDFLALCDQDDCWHADKLATLVKALDANPLAGGAFSDADLIDGAGEPALRGRFHRRVRTLWQVNRFSPRKQRQFAAGYATDLLLQNDIVTGATMMIRSAVLPIIRPIPASWVHDGWITWKLVLASSLIVVPEPLMEYRIHAQQQLGAGGGSRRQRLETMRRTERDRYARVAGQFEDLQHSLGELPASASTIVNALQRKIEFLRRRSRLPHSPIMRVVFILREATNYWKYARGWRSMRKDLFLS